MTPHSRSDSESSEDEGAPEIISLVQSKKAIQKLDAELKKAEMAERQSKRRQNREMDRKLKERADMNRGGKKKGDEANELEARMQRAMQEAQEEMDEEGESESESQGGSRDEDEDENDDDDNDEEDSGEDEEDVSSLEDDQDEEDDNSDDAETLAPKPKKKTYNPDHLPDELFAAAFASQASTSKRKAAEDEEDKPLKQTPKKKKPKRSHAQQDLIVGSRTIRTLPTSGQPITPSVAPSSKINKFLNRSLALKGGKQKTKTWERRPANIGVLRRDGPALNFVRNR